MNKSSEKPQVNQNISFSTKMKLKIGFITFLGSLVIANAITAWALPSIPVECCEDFILHFIENLIQKFNLKLNCLNTILSILLFHSDLIFLITAVKFVLKKFDKKFLHLLIGIWILKIFTDWSFYQHNTHDNSQLSTYTNYFFTSQLNNRNSLFSFPIAIQFLCFIQIREKTNQNLFKWMILLNLVMCSVLFLVIKIFFTFQIIFSYIIVHYLKIWIH